MRNALIATLAATAMTVVALPAAYAGAAGGARVTKGTTLVQQVQRRSGQCEELRRACLNKEKLGERGEGNCQRYRSECRGRDRG